MAVGWNIEDAAPPGLPPMPPDDWSPADVADAAFAALRSLSERLDLEQSPYGVDMQPEKTLQAALAEGMAARFGVRREVHYPAAAGGSRRDGARCDLVLTQGPPLEEAGVEPGLFDPPERTPFERACWVEVKRAGMLGPEGPDPGYAATLQSMAVDDVIRLAADERVRHGMLLLVLFGGNGVDPGRDAERFVLECAGQGLPVGAPVVRRFRIQDRIGHEQAAICVVPVGRL